MTPHCPTCGQALRVAPRAPYNPHALIRIRNGATAVDLGWDETFYASVCRKHGLEAMPAASSIANEPATTPTPLIIVAEPPPRPPAVKRAPITGEPSWNSTTRVVQRGEASVTLTPRIAEIFDMIAPAPAGERINGRIIGERMGLAPGKSKIGSYVIKLRDALLPLDLDVVSEIKRHLSGYSITDKRSGERVHVRIEAKP